MFTLFPELPFELRSLIWSQATATQIQDNKNKLPHRLQKFVSPSSLLANKMKLPFTMRIRDPYEGRNIFLEQNDFDTFVNRLSISAVCRESRARTVEFCRVISPHVQLDYYTTEVWCFKPPVKNEALVLLRNVHNTRLEPLDCFIAHPKILTVDGGKGQFKSPEQLVDIVSRFCGDMIERLILKLWIENDDPLESAYWSDSVDTPEET
jgi:hypothetical protein